MSLSDSKDKYLWLADSAELVTLNREHYPLILLFEALEKRFYYKPDKDPIKYRVDNCSLEFQCFLKLCQECEPITYDCKSER